MIPLHLPKHGLNLDRSSLPQVSSKDVPDYLSWLRTHKHISSNRTEMPVNSLFSSQGNFNATKIRALMTHKREELRKPIIVSGDHYVVDGHHRWIALCNLDPTDTIPVVLVHAKILDLLAATKEYPKSFTKTVVESFSTITEAAEKHAVLAFGRLNPPTSGHAKLVDKVHDVAERHGARHEVVMSHTQDSKKNPLSGAQKLKHAKRFFPDTNLSVSTAQAPSIFHHAAKLYKAGHQHLHVVAGADRLKEFGTELHKYNGHFDKDGHGYKFKSITMHSAGARDPESEGVEGMSAGKLRHLASIGNFKEFKKGVPAHVSQTHAKELYQDVRKGMGHMNEQVDLLSEGVHDSSIFKAIFVTGAPGSGKDFVLKKSLNGHGLTEINSDHALEFLMDKNKLDKKMPESEQEKRGVIRDKAKSLTELRQRLALSGRNGLIVNSTGAKLEQIKKIKDKLEELGYDTKMVFVDVSDNVSRNRNVERGQRGGRMIPEKIRAEKWRQAQDSRVQFSKVFGAEHYHEFNNEEDLRHNADPEVAGQKHKELDALFKTVRKFTQQPPKSEVAHEWIHTNLGKLAKQPIGNKIQQTKASQTPPASDSQAAEEARKLGLQYYGYGRYGKNGHVTHFSLHGRLVEKKKALIPPKPQTPNVPKKLNEAFEELFNKENDDVNLRLEHYLENSVLVGRPEVPHSPRTFAETREVLRERFAVSGGRYGDHHDIRGASQEEGLQEEVSSQKDREESKKVSFQGFRRQLVTLTEGEPVLGGGEEDQGSVLSSNSSKEAIGGGLTSDKPVTTPRRKKLFSDLKRGK
jgi:dephospho-CoA kinase